MAYYAGSAFAITYIPFETRPDAFYTASFLYQAIKWLEIRANPLSRKTCRGYAGEYPILNASNEKNGETNLETNNYRRTHGEIDTGEIIMDDFCSRFVSKIGREWNDTLSFLPKIYSLFRR